MGEERIEVWATGELTSGSDTEAVMDKIKAMFPSATAAQRARFTSGQPFRITTVSTGAVAHQVITRLQGIGIIANARAEVLEPEIELSPIKVSPPPQPLLPAPLANPDPPASDTSAPISHATGPQKPASASLLAWLGIGANPLSSKQKLVHWVWASILLICGLTKLPISILLAILVTPVGWVLLPTKWQRLAVGFSVFMLLLSVYPIGTPQERAEARERTASQIKEKEAVCRADVACIGDRLQVVAAAGCTTLIEARSRYASRWQHGSQYNNFPRVAWADPQKKGITYSGNSLEMQNGFGAWKRISYECDFAIDTRMVTSVRISE